jgi:hypothetical protein
VHPSGKYTLILSSLFDNKFFDHLVLREGHIIHCYDEIEELRDTFLECSKLEVGLVGGEGFSVNLSYDLNPSFDRAVTLLRGSLFGSILLRNEEVAFTTLDLVPPLLNLWFLWCWDRIF